MRTALFGIFLSLICNATALASDGSSGQYSGQYSGQSSGQYSGQPAGQSVGWQKLRLEQTLRERASQVISNYSRDAYVSRVDVLVSSGVKSEARPVTMLSLGKLDIDAPLQSSDSLSSNDDVFGLVQRIEVYATVPKLVLDAKRAQVEKSVSAAISSMIRAPVRVSLEAIPELVADASQADKKDEHPLAAWKDFFENYSLPLVVLLAALMVAILASRFLSIFRSVENKKIEALARSRGDEAETRGFNGETPLNETGRGADSATPGTTAELQEQIRSLATHHPEKVLESLRRWLSADSEIGREALFVFPKIVSMQLMLDVVGQMNEVEKRRWREVLEEPMKPGYEARAYDFVSRQLMEDVLRQSLPVADEIRKRLDGIRPEECAEIAKRDTQHGALLVNILSTAQAARMLLLLPKEIAGRVTAASAELSLDDVKRLAGSLKQSLDSIRHIAQNPSTPFAERALELIREVGPAMEHQIYLALALRCSHEDLKRVLQQVCPIEILLASDRKLHRTCLNALPLAIRAELVFSLPEDVRLILLNAYDPGEKIRELLEAELAQVQSDPRRVQKAQRDADKQWRSYIQLCRRSLHSDESLKILIAPALERWIQTHAGRNGAQDAA